MRGAGARHRCRFGYRGASVTPESLSNQISLNMSISTFQKLTVVSCVVLCVALLLPKMLLSRGKRDTPHSEGPAGHFPPMPHRAPVSEERRHFSKAHNPEAIARAKGAATGASTGGKSNLAGQIIPIYGFGILLYILYILFKITSKGKTAKPPKSRFTAVRSENMKRKITDFELAQLQDRLNETKDVIERIISTASAGSDSIGGAVAMDEEQQLLYQLQEITRVMQEGQFVDTVPANPDHSCDREWDGLPGNGGKELNERFCSVHSPHTSANAQMREETSAEMKRPDEQSLSDPDENTDGNRNTKIEDISLCSSDSQSQPETETLIGSDITSGPVSEHSIIRRRNKQ
ncbi:protein RIC-3b isoform X1 [Carassius auratus]|uniref:Protein RIC-3b isoform X1 n=1 Tax=Carassius auratus TaxID=7957 RepID=A0A6P6MFS5_CARAU|nr:protein RIC-3-like isoform X1 [Carassius auratus]